MADIFQIIKDTVKMEDFFKGYEMKITDDRARFEKCPFCSHKDCADIVLKYNDDYFKCFKCGKEGTIIDVYGYVYNIDSKTTEGRNEIAKRMCKEFNISNDTNYSEDIKKPFKEIKAAAKPEKKEYNFNDLADKLHTNLLNSSEGINYFEGRGLTKEIIKRFKLGYCKGGLKEALKEYPELIKKIKTDDYSKCYPYFIPIYENGVCRNFIVRKDKKVADENSKMNSSLIGIPKVLNLPTLEMKIFNITEAMKSDIVFITEGWCDALSFETLHYSAVALNSVSMKNKFIGEIQKYKDYQSKYYVIALDNDKSGSDTRAELKNQLLKLNCKVYDMYPVGENIKDINDMLLLDSYNLKESIAEKVEIIKEEKEKLSLQDTNFEYLNNTLNKFRKNKNRKILSTGFKMLDDSLGGGLYNNLYIIGGVSGLGKTSIVLNIVESLAKQKQDVLFVSLEMSRDELIAKSLSYYMREESINNFKNVCTPTQREIQNGYFEENQLFNQALKEYSEAAKHIIVKEGNFNYNTEAIRKDIENNIKIRGKAPVLVVDYLQVLNCIKDYSDEKRIIDFNITELKRISRDFDIPVIVISSINRQYYKKAIDFEAFKNSGGIEFTADVVIGLQYTFISELEGNEKDNVIIDKYNEAKKENPKRIQTVILKNRNGSIGNYTNFDFESGYNYFRESNER